MKVNRIVVAVLAAIVILPVTGNTQEVRSGTVVRVSGARGFIGVQTVEVRAPGSSVSRQRAVVDVVAGSPAERAGVVRGDTILRINGAAATAAVMATPYEPGDTITLRVRRNGRERDVKLVAGERPAHSMSLFNGTLVDAEINERINIIRARIHADLDTAHIRTLHITTVRGDSTVVVFGRDTIRTIAVRGTVPLMLDSLHATLRLTHDTLSVLRLHRDSIFTHLRGIET
ncbi:MAG TPA: PDZ domain-containing protein, partial [Longimicrobiales bacterium]|nr:PDZ domain-containing protein [Longimicrobiales bacterium]